MPLNKNAVLRYRLLDSLISDIHNDYTRKDLYEKVNDSLRDIDDRYHVSERTIETDLRDMESIFGFDFNFLVRSGKRYVKYPDPAFSAFAKPLHPDEKKLLGEVLNTLGQFSGLDTFEWMDDLKERLAAGDPFEDGGGRSAKVISFSQNEYLQNRDYLAWFFYAIANRVVIKIRICAFMTDEPVEKTLYPYLLKQYNDRWYIIGTPVGSNEVPYCPETLENYPLDRILEYSEVHDADYVECPMDIEEYYDDVIGVTNRLEEDVMDVVLAVSPLSWEYVRTKPLHWSQSLLNASERAAFAERHAVPEGYVIFRIRCKDNYELRSVIRSFGSNLIVLSPEHFREEMIEELKDHVKMYK